MTDASAASPAPIILVGEDDPVMRVVIESMLESAGYGCDCGNDGEQVLALFDADPQRYAAVVLDVVMPRMDGLQALDAIHARRPALAVVLTSGYSREDLATRIGARAIAGFLRKPWTYEALVDAVEAAVGQPAR